MIELLLYLMLFLSICITLIVVYNFFTSPKIELAAYLKEPKEKISILIPARNEEKYIGKCLRSIQNQSFSNMEILVLDDNSADLTAEIVETFSAKDDRIKLLKGKSLPIGWLGKNWACSQLAQMSSSNVLVFLDADVELKQNALSASYRLFINKKLEMLSVFPTQKINGFGAWLIIPLMNWLLLSFLPLLMVYSSSKKSLVAANGQFLMINKKAYEKIGMHEGVKGQIVEDMEIARKVKANNFKMMTALGGNEIFCEMYSSFNDSFNGFSKNFYSGFKTHTALFLSLLLFFEFLFFFPFLLMFYDVRFLAVYILIIIMRILISLMSKQSVLINVILHPLQILVMYFVGINSMLITISKKAEWKGRRI